MAALEIFQNFKLKLHEVPIETGCEARTFKNYISAQSENPPGVANCPMVWVGEGSKIPQGFCLFTFLTFDFWTLLESILAKDLALHYLLFPRMQIW